MQSNRVEVCIDVGGSGTKISAALESSGDLSPPVLFLNSSLFKEQKRAGEKIVQSIMKVIEHYYPKSEPSLVAISMTGTIDHKNNLLIRSDRLEELEQTGSGYQEYDLAESVRKSLKTVTKKDTKVVLIHDRISACLDPAYQEKLVLTLTLGTFPVIGLSEKQKNVTNVYDNFIQNWVDSICLSTGWNITQELNS